MPTTKSSTKKSISDSRRGVDLNNRLLISDLLDLQIEKLTIGDTINAAPGSAGLSITSTAGTPTELLRLVSNVATPADGDVSRMSWYFNNSVGASTEFARFEAIATDVTAGTGNAAFRFSGLDQGVMRELLNITSSAAGVETVSLVGETDMAIPDGSLSLIDADNANTFSVQNNTITTADQINFNSSSITSGTLQLLTLDTSALITTGRALEIVANAATTPTGVVSVSATDLTDGWDMLLTGGGASATASGGVLDIVSGAATLGTAIRITNTGTHVGTTGVALQIVVDSVTTADIIDINADALISGFFIHLDTASSAMLGGGGGYLECTDGTNAVFTITSDGATAITSDAADVNNAIAALIISKDLVNTGAGAPIAQTNSALNITSVNTNTEAFTMTVSNTLAIITESNTASAAGADVYAGTILDIVYIATTDTTGTATSSTTGLNINYDVVETAGTLTLDDFNVVNIDYDSTGTPVVGDGTYNLLNINGADAGVPVYGAVTLNGANIDVSNIDDTDATLTLYGLNVTSIPYATSGGAAGRFSDGTRVLTFSDGTSHITSSTTLITDMPVTAPGSGFDNAGGVLYVPFGKKGASGMIITEWYIDLGTAGVGSVTDINDVIGETGGGAAYIGQITAANNGTVVAVEIVCVEAPTTGVADIDFNAATANDAVYSDDITAEAGYVQLLAAGGVWAIGDRKVFTTLPSADHYIYLSSGAAGTTGAYGGGIFIMRIYGT